MFQTRQESDAAFAELDRNGDGVISRKEFEAWIARQRGRTSFAQAASPAAPAPPASPPPPAQAASPAAPPAPPAPPPPAAQAPVAQTMAASAQVLGPALQAGQVLKPAGANLDLSEEARAMKDTRRVFALAGPIMIAILGLLPVWSCLALMSSRTYLYFSGWGSPIGGILLFVCVVVGIWMNVVMGVGCPTCPMPNPIKPFSNIYEKLFLIPVEAYAMVGMTIFLMLVWKLVPIIISGGIWAALSWLGGITHFFDLMWFSNNPAATVLSVALTAVVMYVLALNYFFARAKPEARGSVTSLFIIWGIFVLLMGCAFMLLSIPISTEADKAYNELMQKCETGPRTRDLFVTSQALQNLRQTPGCTSQYSVEQCVGFQSTTYTKVLKSMESDFKCAGFCYNPALLVGLGGVQPSYNPVQPQEPVEIPPTLFTPANYQASCDGMAARNMQHFVGAVGGQVFHHGIFLVTVAIILGLFQMLTLCGGYKKEAFGGIPSVAYGTMM